MGMGNFEGKGRRIVKYRDTLRSSVQKRLKPVEMPFGLLARMGPTNHVLDGVPDPMGKGNFGGKGRPIVEYRDFLPSSVQKWLKGLGCGFGWAEGSKSSIAFARWRQCAHMEGHNSTRTAIPDYDYFTLQALHKTEQVVKVI